MKNAISYYFIEFFGKPDKTWTGFSKVQRIEARAVMTEEQSEWNKSEMVKVFLGHAHVNNVWRSWRDEDEKRKAENRSTVALLNSF